MARNMYLHGRRFNQRDSSSEEEEVDESTASWREWVDSPDRSKGDYRCRICMAHMTSLEMWQAHVIGKKHLKNIKKGPGEAPSKVKTLPCNEPPVILEDIEGSDLPIIGLTYVSETKRADRSVAPFYSCHLCHATCTTMSILDHIVSMKHRLNYFEKNHPDLYELIMGMPLSKVQQESVVQDHAYSVEEKDGRGTIEVKMEKPKGQQFSFGRTSSSYKPKSHSDSTKRVKPEPGSSRDSPCPPASAMYGPSPPPSLRTENVPDAAPEIAAVNEYEEDPIAYMEKKMKDATPEQLDNILKYTNEIIDKTQDKQVRGQFLRQRARIANWIFLLNYYRELPDEEKEDFKTRLHDREACLKELDSD